ncbi:Zinc finger Ran-binding domain-containing protein 2 [Aphanomyces cochlioides]|nr:Zinc finger Ran-binding domain-containing protein 2 [Aphanomyces cochlioides]
MFGGGRPGSGDGDWICPTEGCGNINFARRMECNRCFTKRTDIPKKQFGDKKTGLFGPGDWACGKCGNMNWERRNECNICKAPKSSLGPDEKRDGAGGGFNERQERVASARREVADDGYDDFGQRRQKAKLSKAEPRYMGPTQHTVTVSDLPRQSATTAQNVDEVQGEARTGDVVVPLTDDVVEVLTGDVAEVQDGERAEAVKDTTDHLVVAAVGPEIAEDKTRLLVSMFPSCFHCRHSIKLVFMHGELSMEMNLCE